MLQILPLTYQIIHAENCTTEIYIADACRLFKHINALVMKCFINNFELVCYKHQIFYSFYEVALSTAKY